MHEAALPIDLMVVAGMCHGLVLSFRTDDGHVAGVECSLDATHGVALGAGGAEYERGKLPELFSNGMD